MKDFLISQPVMFASLLLVVSCLLCGGLTILLLPMLRHRAMVRPNHRSSHVIPTPQGGGIAVVIATITVSLVALNLFGIRMNIEMFALGIAALFLMAVGARDDLRPVGISLRLMLQLIAIAGVLLSVPSDLRLFPSIGLLPERLLIAIAALWFINLVNFMDGLDWLTVAEIVPVTAALILIGGVQASLPWEATVVAAALCGAMLGFAPFNKPVARLFLGDAGSLPIGLLLGWCLFHLAAGGHLAAALLLPMYYLADATITLVRRALERKPFWQSHREHFYQRATNNNFSVISISRDVFVLNLILAALALLTVGYAAPAVAAGAVIAGACAVAFVLWRFSRPRAAAQA